MLVLLVLITIVTIGTAIYNDRRLTSKIEQLEAANLIMRDILRSKDSRLAISEERLALAKNLLEDMIK